MAPDAMPIMSNMMAAMQLADAATRSLEACCSS